MRKVAKLGAVIVTVGLILAGCSGVDEKRLAELTGDKNLEQVKSAYVLAKTLERPDDAEIYMYWLEENGEKSDPSFSAEMYKKKTEMEIEKMHKEFDLKMKKIREEADRIIAKGYIDYRFIRNIGNEQRNVSFIAANIKYIKDVYYPFLSGIKDEIRKLKRR